MRNDPQDPPRGLTGLDDGPVRSIDAGGIVAWVSDVRDAPATATIARLAAHDRVCAAALAAGDTLPVRFGQTFATDEAAAHAIGARAARLAERLVRVAGCVELRVVVAREPGAAGGRGPADPSGGDDTEGGQADLRARGPGTAFLRRLAREGRADLAREAACERVREAVRAGAGAFIVEQQRCEARRGVSYFPLLVRRDDVDRCREAVRRVIDASEIDLSVLGPFAPYSFAGDA